MRKRLIAPATLVALPLVGVGIALATFQPTILYKPPVIKAMDIASHNSVENMTIRRDGPDFTFENEVSPPMIDPASDPGCESKAGKVACARAGVEKIVVKLGDMNDAADIRLRRSSWSVKQKIDGQAGEDDLEGWKGKQKLRGGEGNDTLAGNKGADVLIGGDGTDICAGGQGEDLILECETILRH
jgi:RTX calcium-binding nonapeptide repeat (4 copies)